jgi:predicted amidophosphoribosyltransferase
MPIDETKECNNCGKNYPSCEEECPKCGMYYDENPDEFNKIKDKEE